MSSKIQHIDAPGSRADGLLLQSLRREVASLLKRSQTSFPGAQPVSFSRKHLEEVRQQDYYVCEKSDGIRYLLYLTIDENDKETHYLIDRKNDYWYIGPPDLQLHFPVPDDEQGFHSRTLADGELVMEKLDNGLSQPKFYVFDCLALDGKVLMERTLDKRLAYFRENVFNPYQALFKKYPQEQQFQAFKLVMKEMQFSYGIEMMFRDVLPNLKHGNDGLIFTCCTTPYRPGTDPHILKWKPAEENTVDFRIRLHFREVEPDEADAAEGITEPYTDWDGVPDAEVWTFHGEGREPLQYYAPLFLSEDDWAAMKSCNDPIDNRIVECGQDDQKRWRLHRYRDDKREANHISTVHSVLQSIQDGVDKQELLDSAKSFKDGWKSRRQQKR